MRLQLALISQDKLLFATLDVARLQSPEARKIALVGLANYFADAALMPHEMFLQAAKDTRHHLEVLSTKFGASLEQVAHRLSTLQRPAAKGIPFFLSEWIKQTRSPSGIQPLRCNLRVTVGLARCGMCTPRLKHLDNFYADWQKLPMERAISVSREMSQNLAEPLMRPQGGIRFAGVRGPACKCANLR